MWLSVDEFGDVFVRGKSKPSTLDPKLSYYCIWKRYYENKSRPDLKIIVTSEGIRYMYTPYTCMLIAHSTYFSELELQCVECGPNLQFW